MIHTLSSAYDAVTVVSTVTTSQVFQYDTILCPIYSSAEVGEYTIWGEGYLLPDPAGRQVELYQFT